MKALDTVKNLIRHCYGEDGFKKTDFVMVKIDTLFEISAALEQQKGVAPAPNKLKAEIALRLREIGAIVNVTCIPEHRESVIDRLNAVIVQLIATFEKVDEDFMEDICKYIPDIRDVKCRWQKAPQDKDGKTELHATSESKPCPCFKDGTVNNCGKRCYGNPCLL